MESISNKKLNATSLDINQNEMIDKVNQGTKNYLYKHERKAILRGAGITAIFLTVFTAMSIVHLLAMRQDLHTKSKYSDIPITIKMGIISIPSAAFGIAESVFYYKTNRSILEFFN